MAAERTNKLFSIILVGHLRDIDFLQKVERPEECMNSIASRCMASTTGHRLLEYPRGPRAK